jgi:phosphoribosyl 1,2-cyclic phosphodiesterase
MNIIVLNSGSNGNAVYVESRSGTGILLDCGISARQVEQRLKVHGRSLTHVRAIYLTHEHTDHVRGVPTLASNLHLPVYLTRGTYEAMRRSSPFKGFRFLEDGVSVSSADITIRAHRKSHDAADPVFFEVCADDRTFLYVTDLGTPNETLHALLPSCDALLIESNYDVHMLESGPYPLHLKQRIQSDVGHLSNTQSMETVAKGCDGVLQHLIFGHLSQHNNSPDIVSLEARAMLANASHLMPTLCIASRHNVSDMITIE